MQFVKITLSRPIYYCYKCIIGKCTTGVGEVLKIEFKNIFINHIFRYLFFLKY